MSWLKTHPKGTILHLYIQPGASRSGFSGLHNDRLKVKIQAPPQDGEANSALIEFLASFLKVSKSKIHLLRGETSRKKDIVIELPFEQLRALFSI